MFIIIVFDRGLKRSSPVSSQDSYCSVPRDQTRDVTPCLGVSINLKSTSFRVLMHLRSGYYYDYVVIGVLRPSWFTEILF